MLPIISTLNNYSAQHFHADIRAGLTTAIMLIPQSMAYAMLAGLSPVHGLYAATIPTAVYSFFGRSRALAVGPVALDSLLVALAVAPIAGDDPVQYSLYATLLMLMMGSLQFLMGLLRLGTLSTLLRPPVLIGFTGAAALIIASTQLPTLIGVSVNRGAILPVFMWELFLAVPKTNGATLLLGIASIALLIFLKKKRHKWPRHLIVVILGMGFIAYAPNNISIVGYVPKGLPSFAVPVLSWEIVSALSGSALTLACVAFLEAYSVAMQTKSREDHPLCPNEELRALGLSNITGSFFQGYPVTGGFSRTAVNNDSGAKTPLSGLFTAIFVVLALLFITPLFVYLPKTVLAAIICTAVLGLIDIQSMKTMWLHDKKCWGVMISSALGTIFLGISWGIALGVALAFFIEKIRGPESCVVHQKYLHSSLK